MRAWLQSNSILLPGLWLAAVPWLLFPTIAPVLTAVSLPFLLVLLLKSSQEGGKPLSLPPTPINPYLLFFLLLTGLAYLVSPLPQVSLPKLTVIYLGAVTFFLLFPRLNNLETLDRLAAVLAVCAGLVALLGFFTLEWPARQVVNLEPITDRLPHLGGSFAINYNEMAGTLLIFFPFVLAMLRKSNGRLKNTLFLFNTIIVIALLFFTQSRGAFMGLVVISLTWWFWGRIPLRKLLPILVILCLVLLLAVLGMGLSIDDLFNWLSAIDAESKQGNAPANSWLTRIEIWQVAGRMLVDYPVIGAGLYTFDPVSRANYIYDTIRPSFNLTHAHNLLLQTGSSLGIGGLLALAGIWITALVGLWQAGRSDNEQIRRLSAVFAASITGYLFFNLYDTITFGQKPGLFVWVVLAGAISLSHLARTPSTAALPAPEKKGTVTLGRLASFVPLLIFILLLLSPAFARNRANLELDRAYLQSQPPVTITAADFPTDDRRAGLVRHLAGDDAQALFFWRRDPESASYVRSQGNIALTAGQQAAAVTWFNLSLELEPESAETYLWRGVANEESGMNELAEVDYRRAADYAAVSEITAATKAYIQYRLGDLLAQKGEWQAAADAFTQATIYQPQETWYYHLLGDALINLGDEAGAADAYERAER